MGDILRLLLVGEPGSSPRLRKGLVDLFPEAELVFVDGTNLRTENFPGNQFDAVWIEMSGADDNELWIDQTLRTVLGEQVPIYSMSHFPSEAKLAAHSQIIQALMDSPLDGLMLITPFGEVLDVNPVMAAGFGKTREDIIGTSTFGLFPAEIAQNRREAVRHVLETGQSFRFQGQGKTEIVDVSMYPVKDDHGLIFMIAILARNISAQRRAEEELRNSNRTIMALMEAAIDVMLIIDIDGRIIYANQTLASVLGISMEKSQGEYFRDLLPNLPVGFSMDQVNSVIKTGKHARFQGEHAGRTYDFTLFPVKNDEGRTIQLGVIGRDVTEIRNFQLNLQAAYTDLERKIDERTDELNWANQELIQRIAQHQKAEAQAATLARVTARISAQNDLTSILQSMSEETIRSVAYPICSIFLYDDEVDAYSIAAVTPPIELTDPFPPTPRSLLEEFIHADTQQIVIPDVREFAWVPGGQVLAQFDIRTLVTIPMMDDGEIIGTLNVASAGEVRLPGNEELVFLKALADQAKIGITKIWLLDRLQASSSRLQMLSKKLVLLQEQEHRNLARELHDEIGQSLTSLRLNLDIISRSIPDVVGDQDEFRLKLDRAAQTTTNLLERIREISLDLRPAMLDDLGLLPALVAFFERYTAQTGIQVSFKHNQVERRFSDDLETATFRIIQEGLTNVARHAACDRVHIRLWADPRFLRLQVEDQGSGFDPLTTLKSSRTSGLTGMLERAASCGGVIEFDSFPGKGTCLTAEFPLLHEKASSNDHIHITGR